MLIWTYKFLVPLRLFSFNMNIARTLTQYSHKPNEYGREVEEEKEA